MSSTSRQTKTGTGRFWSAGALLMVSLLAISGCDQLLEVDLPDAVTSDALNNPATAAVQVGSIMAEFECGYSGLAIDASGFEDVFQRVSGVAGIYSEYGTTGGGGCAGDAYQSGWAGEMFVSRGLGYDAYDRISNWTNEQIAGAGGLGSWESRDQLLATAAVYNAIILDILGEHYCEMAIDEGPLLTPEETLDIAEDWATTALDHVASGGDFALTVSGGEIANSLETLAYGVRARIRWANGDLANAAADAAQVPDGFAAWVLREAGAETERTNNVVSMQAGTARGNIVAAGFVQGPVTVFQEGVSDYGVTILGDMPSGGPWPDPVPFTGYQNLGIVEADGRAVDDDGYPITTDDPGTVADTRVEVGKEDPAGGAYDAIPLKYDDLGADVPLLNWMEMRLIRAEAEGGAAAVGHVNAVRTWGAFGSGRGVWNEGGALPEVTYVDTGDAEAIENMIIEERRRALWLEARFWSTKILNTDKLWFPRNLGAWQNESTYNLLGGVRVLMDNDEYEINPNFRDNGGLDLRGTGCPADQAPIFLS